jgi:hypothetical protein
MQNMLFLGHRSVFKRPFAKFSTNLCPYSRNSLFTLAVKTRNSQQDVSKNREIPSDHSGGFWSLPSEHLAGFRQQKNEHLTSFHSTSRPKPGIFLHAQE